MLVYCVATILFNHEAADDAFAVGGGEYDIVDSAGEVLRVELEGAVSACVHRAV